MTQRVRYVLVAVALPDADNPTALPYREL